MLLATAALVAALAAPAQATAPRQLPVSVGSPPVRGTLTLPAGKGPFPAVVMMSGSGPNDQDVTVGPNRPFRDIALGLAARGVASIRYDKRFHDYPASVDPRTATPVAEYVPDALAAIRLLEWRAAIDDRRIYLLGHSLGGTMAPLVAQRAGRRIAGVVLLAAGSGPLGAAVLRQYRYLATLPGATGQAAKAQLPQVELLAAQIDSPELAKLDPATVMWGNVGPAYYLGLQRYDAVATAHTLRQPILVMQGGRDYQVTVADDLSRWLKGLVGRDGVRVVRLPKANHLFIDGAGRPTPDEYAVPGHVNPKVAATIAAWIAATSR